MVVEFYTKWCKFCKILSPEYDKLAKEYQEKRKDVVISRLEGQANSFTLQRYNIFRFPVIALFKPKSKEMYCKPWYKTFPRKESENFLLCI